MKTIEALGLVGWLVVLQLSAYAAAAPPPLARPDESPPSSLGLIQSPTAVLDPTTNRSNTTNSQTGFGAPPPSFPGHIANINLDCYAPQPSFNAKHAEWVEKAIYRALEDVAAHAGLAGQLMGARARYYPSDDLAVDADLDVAVFPTGAMTWEMWKNALIGVGNYARWYPRYDFRFDVYVRETHTQVGTGYVATR